MQDNQTILNLAVKTQHTDKIQTIIYNIHPPPPRLKREVEINYYDDHYERFADKYYVKQYHVHWKRYYAPSTSIIQ